MKRPTNTEPSIYSFAVQQSAYALLCRAGMDFDRAAYLNHHEHKSMTIPAQFRADREWWLYRHYNHPLRMYQNEPALRTGPIAY